MKEIMEYVMATPISDEIAQQTFRTTNQVRENPKTNHHTEALVEVLYLITHASLDFYFMEPLELFNVRPIGRKIVTLGVQTSLGITNHTGKKLIRDLNSTQLIQLADWLDSMIIPSKNDHYMLACPISKEEAELIFDVTHKIRESPIPRYHTDHAVSVVLKIASIALHFYCEEPVDMLGIGPFGKKLVNMGINTGMRLLRSTCRKLVNDMTETELIAYADFLDSLLSPVS